MYQNPKTRWLPCMMQKVVLGGRVCYVHCARGTATCLARTGSALVAHNELEHSDIVGWYSTEGQGIQPSQKKFLREWKTKFGYKYKSSREYIRKASFERASDRSNANEFA